MRSTSFPSPVTWAVGWRRVMNAFALLCCTVLLVLAAAGTARAAVTGGHAAPTAISITDPMALATDVNVAADSVASGEHAARSIPPRRSMHPLDDACPFEPDLWLDDDDDDDDDDDVARHGVAARRAALSVEEALGLRRPSRTLGGSAVPDGSLPVNLLLSESIRRM
jgi:hypothetical protein